jgi:hypothetical protein
LDSRFGESKWQRHQKVLMLHNVTIKEILSHEIGVEINSMRSILSVRFHTDRTMMNDVIDFLVNSKYVEISNEYSFKLLFLKPRCPKIDFPHCHIPQCRYIK